MISYSHIMPVEQGSNFSLVGSCKNIWVLDENCHPQARPILGVRACSCNLTLLISTLSFQIKKKTVLFGFTAKKTFSSRQKSVKACILCYSG